MPRKPDNEEVERLTKKRDPRAVLNATINAMKNPELEDLLVERGLAVKVD